MESFPSLLRALGSPNDAVRRPAEEVGPSMIVILYDYTPSSSTSRNDR
jgi:hypothetical protein